MKKFILSLIFILSVSIGGYSQTVTFATVGVQDMSGIDVEVEHYVNYVPNHSISSVTYNPQNTGGTSVNVGDDSNVGPFNIGFNFEFYGQTFTQFRICTNGFITFGNTAGTYSPTSFPSSANPNGVVAAYWTDLYPSSGYYIRYQTVGTSPNRQLIVSAHLTYYSNRSAWVDYQIILFEGTNKVQTTITSQGWTPSATQGVENHNGTLAATPPGRNKASFNGAGTTYEYTPMAAVQQWESQGTQTTTSSGAVSFSNPSGWDYRVNIDASNMVNTFTQSEMNYLAYLRMFPNEISSWDYHTMNFYEPDSSDIVTYSDVFSAYQIYNWGQLFNYTYNHNYVYSQSEKDDIEVNANSLTYHLKYPKSAVRTFNNLNRFYIVSLGKHRRTTNTKTITQ
jgi:hypothetical protein